MADDVDFEKGEESEQISELVSEQKFKGRPVLVLKRSADDKYPFSMGLGKCKLIIDNYEAIEEFVQRHGGQ
jgi:hypothetical protein